MLLPIRPIRGAWPRWIERIADRFFWRDPSIIVNDEVAPGDFRKAMFAIHVGGTYKITWAGRHGFADDMLLEHVDLSQALIVDVGASDGSTSVDLVEKLDTFGSFVITDQYIELTWVLAFGRLVFFDHNGVCVLVAGKRMIAWPAMSPVVRVLYAPLIRATIGKPRTPVLLLNPRARELLRLDPRITARQYDVFTPWEGTPPNVIRVANLLRRLYFSDEKITRALEIVHANLADQGHFIVIDHHREHGIPPRAGLYRKVGRGFQTVAETPGYPPEIADLILAVGSANVPSSRDTAH